MSAARANRGQGTNQYQAKTPTQPPSKLMTTAQPQPLLTQAQQPAPATQLVLTMYESALAKIDTARNTNTPPEILAELSRDINWEVREAVALHPSCTPTVFDRLSRDHQIVVRRAAATNPSCPAGTLNKLCVTTEQTARTAIDQHQPASTVQALAAISTAIARNPNSSPGLLAHLSGHNDRIVRECVAINPQCPAPALRKLAADPAEWVRQAVANNPSCPPEILQSLAQDQHWTVKDVATARLAATPAT